MPSMMASKHIQLHCQTVRQKPEHSTQRNMQQTTPTLTARSFFPATVFCNFFYFFSICARTFKNNRRITLHRLWVLACSWAFCVCLQHQPPAFDGQAPRASDAHKPNVLVNATADIFSIKKRSTYMHQHVQSKVAKNVLVSKRAPRRQHPTTIIYYRRATPLYLPTTLVVYRSTSSLWIATLVIGTHALAEHQPRVHSHRIIASQRGSYQGAHQGCTFLNHFTQLD
jgi:hypothetical protein